MQTIRVPHGSILSVDRTAHPHASLSRVLLSSDVDLCWLIGYRDQPAVYQCGKGDAEREVAKGPHNAGSQLLILYRGEIRAQVSIRGVQGRLGKAKQRSQHNILRDRDAHTSEA